MSTWFAAVVVLLMLAIFYFRWRQASRVAALMQTGPPLEPAEPIAEFGLPGGYCFHPGHTWMAEQERETARVGIDGFAANLMGNVQKISVVGEQRWVRQGQRLMTLAHDGESVEMLSPLEGVVVAINPEVMKDPGLVVRDPYGQGWVCAIKSPEVETNRRNLVQGSLTSSWMQNSVKRLKTMLAAADPALAHDGAPPAPGSLNHLSPELRKRVVNEFFLT